MTFEVGHKRQGSRQLAFPLGTCPWKVDGWSSPSPTHRELRPPVLSPGWRDGSRLPVCGRSTVSGRCVDLGRKRLGFPLDTTLFSEKYKARLLVWGGGWQVGMEEWGGQVFVEWGRVSWLERHNKIIGQHWDYYTLSKWTYLKWYKSVRFSLEFLNSLGAGMDKAGGWGWVFQNCETGRTEGWQKELAVCAREELSKWNKRKTKETRWDRRGAEGLEATAGVKEQF